MAQCLNCGPFFPGPLWQSAYIPAVPHPSTSLFLLQGPPRSPTSTLLPAFTISTNPHFLFPQKLGSPCSSHTLTGQETATSKLLHHQVQDCEAWKTALQVPQERKWEQGQEVGATLSARPRRVAVANQEKALVFPPAPSTPPEELCHLRPSQSKWQAHSKSRRQ